MGIYPLTFARMMLGPFARVAATAELADGGFDLDVAIAATHEGGAVSALTTSMTSDSPRTASIATDEGRLDLPADFHHPPYVVWTPSEGEPERIESPAPVLGTGLGNEAAHVQDCLRDGLTESPLRAARPDPRAARRHGRDPPPDRRALRRRRRGRPHRWVRLLPRGDARVEVCPPTGAADLVIVANRLPVDRITNPDGSPGWRGSPGGLVTAIEPIMRANSGIWVGWPGDSEPGLEPFEYDGMTLDPISLSEDEIAGFYEGFSNATLWPLYHDLVAKPEFHREWWDAYVSVNQRFAEHAASRAAEDATVWVHDYQLQLVPQLLRELRPDLRIGFYLHIPFPPAELFQQLPWRRQLLEGLLGADLVGFQLPGRRRQLRPAGPPARRPQDPPRPRLPARGPHGPRGRVPDLDRLQGLREAREVRGRRRSGPPRSAPPSATRPRCSSASTGSTTPRASTRGSARSPS